MTPRETFKFAFMARCVELGLGPAEMLTAAKQANDKIAGFLGDVTGVGKDVVGAGATALPLALLAPPIIGALGGYGLSRMTDVDDTDIAEVKDRELLETYKNETAKLERQKAVRNYRAALSQRGRYTH